VYESGGACHRACRREPLSFPRTPRSLGVTETSLRLSAHRANPTALTQMPTTDEAETQTQMPLRQVLIPVDGTPQSEFMVDWALGNFCREGDQGKLFQKQLIFPGENKASAPMTINP
jgi:hypothetical protein